MKIVFGGLLALIFSFSAQATNVNSNLVSQIDAFLDDESNKKYEKKLNEAKEKIQKAQKEILENEKRIRSANATRNMLQRALNEYDPYKAEFIKSVNIKLQEVSLSQNKRKAYQCMLDNINNGEKVSSVYGDGCLKNFKREEFSEEENRDIFKWGRTLGTTKKKLAENLELEDKYILSVETALDQLREESQKIFEQIQSWFLENGQYLPYSAATALNACSGLVERHLQQVEKHHLDRSPEAQFEPQIFKFNSGSMLLPEISKDVKIRQPGSKPKSVQVKTSLSNKQKDIADVFPQISLQNYKKLALRTVKITSQLPKDQERITEIHFLYDEGQIVGVKRLQNDYNTKRLFEKGHSLFEFSPDCKLINNRNSLGSDPNPEMCKEYFKTIGTNYEIIGYVPRKAGSRDIDASLADKPSCKVEMGSKRPMYPLAPYVKPQAWNQQKIKYVVDNMKKFFQLNSGPLSESEKEALEKVSDSILKQVSDGRCKDVINDPAQVQNAAMFSVFENRCRVHAPFFNPQVELAEAKSRSSSNSTESGSQQ